MADFAHESVLLAEVLAYLSPQPGELFCDGTLGGAGHAAAVLATPNTRLVGIDRDPAALAAARERLGDRATLIHGELGDIKGILGDQRVNGFLLDLGVSSPQLDQAERGFSFTHDGPLDMRMDPTRGPTALDLMKELDDDELVSVLAELGEERYAKKIARMIKEWLREDRLHTTKDLAELCSRAIPLVEQRKSKIHPATRTFQGLRIAVNRELDQLERFLAAFPDLLVPGGRCVIISFHSLEDRLVKQAFRDLAWTSSLPAKLARDAGERVDAVVEILTKKAVFATDDEIARNPRSRSARLRACRRTEAPNLPMGAPRTTVRDRRA
ncbi:MAG: 16S rRNA (cytosine(1402)-N(4))-methyltransferase RsmH [Deltaproteobacteria bacterium]|nr:16S rRNA (cytosine(1402)-N(4))-methyltransferase RsmH [Deltaproteobacteria bacterium]